MAKVFICYAHEDLEIAKKLYFDLKRLEVDVWIDNEDLLPGQNWRLAIKQAIRESIYFLALLSTNSINKRGFVQKELRMAIDTLDEMPEGSIFLIPIRLEDCIPLHEKLSELHWVNLFESYEGGLKKLLRVLTAQQKDQSEREKIGFSDERIRLPINEENNEVHMFRFRAECEHDVNELYKIIYKRVWRLTKTNMIVNINQFRETTNEIGLDDKKREEVSPKSFAPLPDVEVEIETNLSLKELRKAMLEVVDGHVMVETAASKNEYTGERTYRRYTKEGDVIPND